MGAHERLGLLELWPRTAYEKMVKVGGVKIYDRFSYLLNKLIFSICLKGGKGLRVVDLVVKWI